MRKLITLIAFIATTAIFAQAPLGFNYQATVRNASGTLIVNQNVYFKFNVMLNSQTSVPVFTETHYVPTDDLGQVNLVVGQGTATAGSFSNINWGSGNYYLGIELNTGAGYVAMGTTQLLSVPYALYANSAGSTQAIIPNLASVLAVNNGANNLQIKNLANPTDAQDAVTKGYLDSKNQYRTSIYLTGNITDAEAAALITTQLGPVTENIIIQNTTQLTTVDLSALKNAVSIRIGDNEVLTSVDFSGLKAIYEEFNCYDTPLNNLSFPLLTNAGSLSIGYCSLLTTVTFPALINAVGIGINSCPLLTTVDFPVLEKTTDNINFLNNSLLTTITFPALTDNYGLNIEACPLLTTVTFPALKHCYSLELKNNALSIATINALLNKMLLVTPSSGKNIILSGQTPLAPPSGQGIIDKQTLINGGNTVETD